MKLSVTSCVLNPSLNLLFLWWNYKFMYIFVVMLLHQNFIVVQIFLQKIKYFTTFKGLMLFTVIDRKKKKKNYINCLLHCAKYSITV